MLIIKVNAMIRNTGFKPLSMKLRGTFDTAITPARPTKAIPNPIKSSTMNNSITNNRVAIKRMIDSPLLVEIQPDFQIKGKTVRYDIYLSK
jgi:hypothetical protein